MFTPATWARGEIYVFRVRVMPHYSCATSHRRIESTHRLPQLRFDDARRRCARARLRDTTEDTTEVRALQSVSTMYRSRETYRRTGAPTLYLSSTSIRGVRRGNAFVNII